MKEGKKRAAALEKANYRDMATIRALENFQQQHPKECAAWRAPSWNRGTKMFRSFWMAYERLEEQGKCDSPGGNEYDRVILEWLMSGCPEDMESFITEHANLSYAIKAAAA
jgi:hypothetical protein